MKIKYFLVISFFQILINCNGQEKEPIKPEEMYTTEKFDVEKFNKDRMITRENYDPNTWEKVYITEPSSNVFDTLSDGTIIQRSGGTYVNTGVTEYSEKITPPPPIMFCTFKVFYANGSLKEKYVNQSLINGYAPSGIEYYYDEKGKLTKKVDNDKLYQEIKITPKVLFDILNKEKIYDRKKDSENILTIDFRSDSSPSNQFYLSGLKIPYKKGDIPFWEVYMSFYLHDGNPPFQKIYKVDAMTGKVTEISTISLENSIEAASNNIQPEVYKTHKGKTYTQEEWKVFEEQEYQNYVAKKNNRSFLADE